MRCDECREKLVEYIEGLLPDQETQQLKSHLGQCSQCRTELDQLTALGQRLTSDAKNRQSADVENRVVNRIICEQNRQLKQAAGIDRQLQTWRIIMKSKITKLTAAAIILIAAFVSLTLLKTVTPAYAIEQTIEASRDLRFIRLHCEPAGDGVEDMWVQFDEQGQLLNLRMQFPNTADGPKDVVWQEGKAQVWFKAKNSAAIVREEAILDRLKMSYYEFDPKSIVQGLYENNRQGHIEIQESQSTDEPILITYTLDSHRSLFKVDPQTRLLQQIDKYELQNGEYKFLGLIQYLDYNQPVDPELFVLKLPADVLLVDQTTQAIGLEQGQMTDDQAAVETARRFWQAIIKDDFDQAGQYLEGVPGATLKKIFEEKMNVKFIEIVSVGPVQPHPNPQTGGVVVPCKLKVQKNGQTEEMTFDRLGVRQVYNQPGRWTIFGGI